MRAQLIFNLDNYDDEMAHKRCVKSTDMAVVLWELVHNSKKKLEHSMDSDSITRYDALDMVFDKIVELLNESNIDIDTLIN